MATPNPVHALMTATSAAYAAAGALAKSGGNLELAAAYDTVRDVLDMIVDSDEGECALALLSGTVKVAAFCREHAAIWADLAEHDDDAETAADSLRIANDLRTAAGVFAKLGR